jgi:hypothetical protein
MAKKKQDLKREYKSVTIKLKPHSPPDTDVNAGRAAERLGHCQQHEGPGILCHAEHREIANSTTLGFFTKHPDFNRMRGEISFTGAVARRVGIEFTKRQVNLDEELAEGLGKVLIPTCRSIKRVRPSAGPRATPRLKSSIGRAPRRSTTDER